MSAPVVTWLEGRNTKIKAQAEAEAEVMKTAAKSSADWEYVMARNSGSSWKDEYLVLLFSIPMILAFIPGGEVYVNRGFDVLASMPDWYQYTLSIIVAASFGVRSAIGFLNRTKRNPNNVPPQ